MLKLDIFGFIAEHIQYSNDLYYSLDLCIFFLFSSLSLENNLYEAKDLFELSGLLYILTEKKDENEDEWI